MEMRSTVPMRVAKSGYIVMSAVFCLLGALLIAQPDRSLAALGRALGVAMAMFGVVKLVGYFSRDLFRLAFQYDLELGILLLVLGAVVALRPAEAAGVLTAALGISVLTDGLFKIRIALDARRFGIRCWLLILVLAVVTGGAGLLLALRPWEGARLLARLLGASLLCEGVLNFCVAVSTVKIVANQRPDRIEGEYMEIQAYE